MRRCSVIAQVNLAVVIAMLLAFVVAAYLGFRRDALAKTVVLFYAFDEHLERAYEALHESAKRMAACAGTWHIAASAQVYEGSIMPALPRCWIGKRRKSARRRRLS